MTMYFRTKLDRATEAYARARSGGLTLADVQAAYRIIEASAPWIPLRRKAVLHISDLLPADQPVVVIQASELVPKAVVALRPEIRELLAEVSDDDVAACFLWMAAQREGGR